MKNNGSMKNNNGNIIEVKNLKKVYKMGSERIIAVDDVSFNIKKGEFCCIFGVSGSGKSTLLNLMAGIEKATGGQILIKGKDIRRMNERNLAKFRQNNLGFVFQSYNLLNAMTALENVELPLVFKHVTPRKRKKMSREMLIKVGLGSRLKHKPKEMSGGQQQRVGIARAFVSNPEIVFADEPTGNLDSKTSKEVMELIVSMARTNNQTIVMVTHDQRLTKYADRIIHIFDGRIEEIEVLHNDSQTQEAAQPDTEAM
jgi:putative ABC transport system ATP-binding protein